MSSRSSVKSTSKKSSSQSATKQRQDKGRSSKQSGARKLSATSQQAMRTGGWANPSQGGERKYTDVDSAITVPLAAPTFSAGVLLNSIAQGTSASERIGRKLTMKSLFLRHSHELNPTSTGGSPLRVLVVYDKQANAAAPAITDILQVDDFQSPNNLSNRDRFVTLIDEIMDVVSANANVTAADTNYKSINLEMLYNAGTTGAIGSITSGSMYLFVAQTGNIATTASVYDFYTRVRYTDV